MTIFVIYSIFDHITLTLEKKNVAGVQITAYDFSKAFDRLRHDVILQRMIECSMPNELISWIESYLEDRTQCVKIGTTYSSSTHVTSGVPQGSLLGPFLFSIVIGSLQIPQKDCCMIKFADDVTICAPIYHKQTSSLVSEAHDAVVDWSHRYKLPLNVEKCRTMLISSSKECHITHLPNVEAVERLRILGVTFDQRVSWSSHVESVAKSASKRLFLLRLLKPHVSDANLKVIYFGLMRSIMEYAAPLLVGLSKTDAKKLEALQKRFHKLLCGPDCANQCLPSLAQRRNMMAAKLYRVASSDNHHLLNPILCRISPSGRYIIPAVTTTRRLSSFVLNVALHINESFKR